MGFIVWSSQEKLTERTTAMWLKNGDHSALVSPQGGSILQWQWREHMILGPTHMVRVGDELKSRGESHWCYPNFGTAPPEWQAVCPKHGPFRKILLEPQFGETFQFAEFTGKPGRGGAGMKVDYNLGTDGLIAKLSVDHLGKLNQRVPILPAFHPYFLVPTGLRMRLTVRMGDKELCWAGNSGSCSGVSKEARVYERGDNLIEVTIDTVGKVTLDLPDDCTHIVVWSDYPCSYVCVEPIFGKPGTFGKPEGRWIDPGERIECNVRLDFTSLI